MDKIGRYAVLGELGRGAMGVVYRARKASLPDREVALKEVPLGIGDAERARRMREARMLLRMHSVHIVQLHDVVECPERASLCIVMEKLRAETLRDRMTSAGGPMDVDEAMSTVDQILDAVEAAHGATDESGRPGPIVHRDLKPENIGYQAWRSGEIVKVMDFGIARVVEGGSGPAPHATLQAYTPAYASPEVLCGQLATTAADLFAVGVIFWEMLGGRHPFSDARGRLPHAVALLGQITTQPVPALPSHLLLRLPEALVDLVRDLCATDPRLRPIAHEARERLVTAGYGRVRVETGDGWDGVTSGAPYDRIELTASVTDISPRWSEQLAESGLIVAPLLVRATQTIAGLRKRGDRFEPASVVDGSFMALRGPHGWSSSGTTVDKWLVARGDGDDLDVEALTTLLKMKPTVELDQEFPSGLAWRAMSLLALTEPDVLSMTLKEGPGMWAVGITEPTGRGLAVAHMGGGPFTGPLMQYVGFGDRPPLERLRAR
ncbi:MAG: protein kinase domain-containing protein, partial [bacterium]